MQLIITITMIFIYTILPALIAFGITS